MTQKDLARCQTAMDRALSYEEWQQAAAEFDQLAGHDDWKREKECVLYDYRLIAARTALLRRLRRENKVERLIFYLREEMHGNLGNMANPALYQVARIGTKKAISDYLDEVVSASVLTGWRMENGHHMAALRITLAPGWKTYWRAPGEAGIPPRFDWTGSDNLSAVTVHWPDGESESFGPREAGRTHVLRRGEGIRL